MVYIRDHGGYNEKYSIYKRGLHDSRNGIPSHIRSHHKIIWPDSVFHRWAASYPSAYVIVNLKRPADFTDRVDWNRPEDRERRRRSVVNAQARALERLRPERVQPTGRFEYIYVTTGYWQK